MIALIIWGTRGIESTLSTGRFFCPTCATEKSYSKKRVRRFFTLYFIPLIPLDTVGTYIECRVCTGTYQLDVLNYDPRADQEEAEAEFRKVMRRVMVDIMMADGVLDQDELKTLAEIYQKVGGKPFSKQRLKKELDRLEREGTEGTIDFLFEAKNTLNRDGKGLVIRAALAVAAADGEFQEEEQILIGEYAEALGVGPKQYKALIGEVFEGNA